MQLDIENKEPARDEVLYVRVQKVNKDFITKAAKESGFKDVATYVDKIFSALRESDSKKKSKKKG